MDQVSSGSLERLTRKAIDAGGALTGNTKAHSAGDCILRPDRIPAHVMSIRGLLIKRLVRFLDMKVREEKHRRVELFKTMLGEIVQGPSKDGTSLVQNSETEQMFAELGSEKNYQLDQPPSPGIEDNASSKQINDIKEAGLPRSSSFDGLGGSSDGRGLGRAPERKSLFLRPVLKKSLVASAETDQTFSRLRCEQSEDELRFDAKDSERDSERESGYQSDSLLDGSRSESRSSSRSTSRGSDGNCFPPAGARKRKSLFTHPLLKQPLVATSETEESFRLQAKQGEDTRSEKGFDTGAEGGNHRTASFEGIIGSDSPNSSQNSDRILDARPS